MLSRLCSLMLLMSLTSPAHAYFQMDLMKNKQANKETSRWTLVDWLAQKNRMALMDHWLAMNRSANTFDIDLSGSHNEYQLRTTAAGGALTDVTHRSRSYNLDMYISIFNLAGEYEKTDNGREAYGGAVGLRLLGTSSQSTSLTLRYGIRRLHDENTLDTWRNQFAEGEARMYVWSFFGIHGKFRQYFPDESDQANKLEGRRGTAGAFIDIFSIQMHADYFEEPMTVKSAAGTQSEKRTGWEYGLSVFL